MKINMINPAMGFVKRTAFLLGAATPPGLGTVLRAGSRAEAHHAEDLAAQPGRSSMIPWGMLRCRVSPGAMIHVGVRYVLMV